MRFTYIFLTCSILFAACTNTSNKTASATDSLSKLSQEPAKPASSALNDTDTKILVDVVSKYYTVKDAFVATKAQAVDSAARQLMVATDSLKARLLTNNAQPQLAAYTDTMLTSAKAITESKDASCEEQRLFFSKLSDVFFVLLQKVQLKNANVYREFCPMAFNEKGAYWLSNESEIKNPYFGKKMLECGDVADSLK